MRVEPGGRSEIRRVRIPGSDVASADAIATPPHVKTARSRRFAVLGAAILEKLCRSSGMTVLSRKTTPYVIATPRGNVAVSVVVSSIRGDPASKHVIIPCTSMRSPRGVVDHVFVAAFVSKGSDETMSSGVDTNLAGWIPLGEVRRRASCSGRITSRLSIVTVPVRDLYGMNSLREYVYGDKKKEDDK